jgi:hypothetical protein
MDSWLDPLRALDADRRAGAGNPRLCPPQAGDEPRFPPRIRLFANEICKAICARWCKAALIPAHRPRDHVSRPDFEAQIGALVPDDVWVEGRRCSSRWLVARRGPRIA